MKNNEQISIAALGLWHLGCVYTASFAKLGFTVVGYDEDKKIVDNLQDGVPPLYEPKLSETIKKHLGKNLSFSTSIKKSLNNRDYVFITYDLPVDNLDRVRNTIIKKTFDQISRSISPETTIVISSQVAIGTCRRLINLLKKRKINSPKVIYFPENLRLGNAFKTFLEPDRIVLGSDNKNAMEQFKRDFSFNCPILTIDLESAEMTKHALNSYLAMCISFSSELSDLSEKTGANMIDVVAALKTDKRVSFFAPLNPGLGFAGGTLGRDIKSLQRVGEKNKYETKLLNAVYAVNSDRLPYLISKIRSFLTLLDNKKIGILGLTYTPKTDTLRRSMSLQLAYLLNNKKCQIKAFDPAIKTPIQNLPFLKVCLNFEDFFRDLDLVILMTEWPEFKEIDLAKVSQLMKQKKVIDTKNFLEPKIYWENNFKLLRMGVGTE